MELSQECKSISLIMSKINGLSQHFAMEKGVNPYTAKVLYALQLENNITQRQISESTGMPKQTVNKIVSELKSEGYVILSDGKKDKREKTLSLTESGILYQEKMLSSLVEMEDNIVNLMGEQAYTQLLTSLEKYCEALECVIGGQR